MTPHTLTFRAALQRFAGAGGWHYVVVPATIARELRTTYRANHGGWSSLRVLASIGATRWQTSIFWMKEGGYLLFIKASVRKAEELSLGSRTSVRCTLLNV